MELLHKRGVKFELFSIFNVRLLSMIHIHTR